MNFKMLRQARNRNNVSHIVALHSNIFVVHKNRGMYWNVMVMEVGSTANKRRLQYCADELTHRQLQIVQFSKSPKVTDRQRQETVAEVYGVTIEVA